MPSGQSLCPQCRTILHIAGRANLQLPLLVGLRVGCAFVHHKGPHPSTIRRVAVRELLACYPHSAAHIRQALQAAVE